MLSEVLGQPGEDTVSEQPAPRPLGLGVVGEPGPAHSCDGSDYKPGSEGYQCGSGIPDLTHRRRCSATSSAGPIGCSRSARDLRKANREVFYMNIRNMRLDEENEEPSETARQKTRRLQGAGGAQVESKE